MEQLSAFWDQVVAVWRMSVLGVSVERIVVAGAILTVFILLRKLFAHFIVGALKRLAKRTETNSTTGCSTRWKSP